MYCFRKYGHNENDEPSFTQPVMYERIKRKASPVEVYSRHLVEQGVVSANEVTRDDGASRRGARGRARSRQGRQATARRTRR